MKFGTCGHPLREWHGGTNICRVCGLVAGREMHTLSLYSKESVAAGVDHNGFGPRVIDKKWIGDEVNANTWTTTGRGMNHTMRNAEDYRFIEARTRRLEKEALRRSEQSLPEGAYSCWHRVGHTLPAILRPAYDAEGRPLARSLNPFFGTPEDQQRWLDAAIEEWVQKDGNNLADVVASHDFYGASGW